MKHETPSSTPPRRYAAAHRLHYQSKDLRAALELYEEILANDSGTPEAGFSRSQIDNIVRAVVPEQTLQAAQLELARRHLEEPTGNPAEPARSTS